MSHGISGYNGRINLYRQLEQLSNRGEEAKGREVQKSETAPAAARTSSLGPGLSETESRMIQDYFPESEQMTLRLYGPGRRAENVNPNAVGQRLDVRG